MQKEVACKNRMARLVLIGRRVSSSKEKKDADSGERGAQRQKRSKDKLIRLDDLIPDEKVVGGRQLFGANTTQNQKHN